MGKDLKEGINSSSYISDKYSDDTIYSKYLLDLHKIFLKDCKEYLAENGVAICNIGIRFPIHIYEQLFEISGFLHRILVMGIKEQTEALDVLTGYYAASVKYGTTIYYYRLDKIDSRYFKK